MKINNEKFKGIFTALLTPFDQNDKVNTKALEELVDLNLKMGVQGFYVGGSTAEAFLLSQDERKLVYETVAKAVDGKVTLIAHVGCISTAEAIEYGKYAKSLGYDAISAIAPFYYKFNFAQIKQYYYDIVNAVDMPMIIYNFPNFSGVNLTVDQVEQFFCDDRFIGIKHTSNDYFAMEQFKTRFPEKLVYNGFDEMLLSGLAMGADGGIGSTYNFMADKYIEIVRLFKENKLDEARAIQQECNRIITALIAVGVMEGEKEVLCQLGLNFGHARAPFSVLNSDQKAFIKAEITDRL